MRFLGRMAPHSMSQVAELLLWGMASLPSPLMGPGVSGKLLPARRAADCRADVIAMLRSYVLSVRGQRGGGCTWETGGRVQGRARFLLRVGVRWRQKDVRTRDSRPLRHEWMD